MDFSGSAGSAPSFSHTEIRRLLDYTRSISPVIIVVVFLLAFVSRSIISARKVPAHPPAIRTGPGGRPLPTRMRSTAVFAPPVSDFSPNAKLTFKWLSVGVLLTFVADAAITMTHVIVDRQMHWWCGQSRVIYIVFSFFAYTVILISLVDTTPSPTYAQLLPWTLTIPLELIILGGCLALYTSPHHEPIVGNPAGGPLRNTMTSWETVEIIIAVVRVLTLLGIVVFYTLNSIGWESRRRKDTARFASREASETTRLLNGHLSGMNGDGYGSSPNRKHDPDPKPAEDAWVRPTTVPSTSWWEYLSGYSLFFLTSGHPNRDGCS
ncbi:hypothetical protein BDFG_01393 [Blastomyces dermatitidis ATCC 26199]|nr:hypothetical protein BDFG_01393 [Blastomyces dermatitidis ATCC 26199]